MARFRFLLIGSAQPIELDLPAEGIEELSALASTTRFISGHLSEPDHDGVCPGVLIPTCRLQMVVEAD